MSAVLTFRYAGPAFGGSRELRFGSRGAAGLPGTAGPNVVSGATATALTGALRGNGSAVSALADPSPSPAGTYTLASITVDSFGRVTAASSGTGVSTSADTRWTATLTASTGNGTYQTTRFGRAAGTSVVAGSGPNTLVGEECGASLTTGTGNTFVGLQAGYGCTTGGNNTVIGSQVNIPAAVSYAVVLGGSHLLSATGDRPIVIGAGSAPTNSPNDSIFLGANCHGGLSNRLFTGPWQDAYTLLGLTSTSVRPAAEVGRAFADSTDATRAGRLTLSAYSTTTAQEGLRVDANSGGVRLGFFGQTAVARQSLPAAGSVTAADIRAALLALGLCQ